MKHKFTLSSVISLVIVLLTTIAVWAEPVDNSVRRGVHDYTDTGDKIAIAYVIDRFTDLPDPKMFTHIIYSSALFNKNLDGVVLRFPENLKTLSELKKKNPDLKIILGLGDFRKPGFCEMAGNKGKRKAYVKSVMEIIQTYDLDGVDLDWEFPTIAAEGQKATPQDDRNYVRLAKDLRKALGTDAWISYYSNFSGKWIDHKGMLPYVSYVNVSGYNMAAPREGKPMLHHSALYPSERTGKQCVLKAIEDHLKLGIPKEKILVGIPFYGKGQPPLPSEVSQGDFPKYVSGLSMKWDDEAQAPYFSDDQGNLIMGFDDERSIAAKFEFIRSNGLPGIFVWCHDFDSKDHKLGKVIEKLRKATRENSTRYQDSSESKSHN